jgi:hypothetical protein
MLLIHRAAPPGDPCGEAQEGDLFKVIAAAQRYGGFDVAGR